MQKHLDAGKQVTLKLEDIDDRLKRMSKWKEFTATSPTQFSNFVQSLPESNHATAEVTQPTKSVNLTATVTYDAQDEIGDHADLAVQSEGTKRQKKKSCDPGDDDCGEDVSSLHVPETSCMFETAYDCESEASTDGSQVGDSVFQSYFQQRYRQVMDDDVPMTATTMQAFYEYLGSLKDRTQHDLIEVFGGKSGCTKVGVKRGLQCGDNQDLVCGIDLTKRSEQKALKKYMHKYRPRVAIMGPPCTAFGSWANLNAVINPEAHAQNLRIGIPLANLAARLAWIQLNNGRHFLAENPWASALWKLPSWQRLLLDARVHWTYVDQCQYNLVDMDGNPTMKPTAFVGSDEKMLDELHRVCPKDHQHSQLVGALHGVNKTRFAQTWTLELCTAIVKAVINLIRRMNVSRYAYPASASKPEVAVAEKPCPGCKQHASRDDDRHTRGSTCRYPHDISRSWECPSCKTYKHVSHPGHVRVAGICRWAEASKRPGASRRVQQPPAEEADDPSVPPVTKIGIWEHVRSAPLLRQLEVIRHTEGWHVIKDQHAHVSFDTPHVRAAEPAFRKDIYPRRSVFGFFPELEGTGWWQVQNNELANQPANIGYPVSIVVVILHPIKNKGEVEAAAQPDDPDELDWYRDTDETPPKATTTSTSSSSKSNPLRDLAEKWSREEELADEQLAKAKRAKFKPIVDNAPGAEGDEPELEQLPMAPPQADDQAQVAVVPDWTNFDLGRALRTLRSESLPHIVRTLRQLHVRWWHAKEERMRGILVAAGVPQLVIDNIKAVCVSCRICRLWAQTGRSAVTTTRLSTLFNQTVQADLLFLGPLIVLHICDECTRFSGGGIIKNKSAAEILPAFARWWCRIFGPPTTLIADHESALCGEEAAIFYERWNIAFKPKARGTHAYIVERHNAIMRTAYNHIRAQLLADGFVVDPDDLISEVFYAKNAMLLVHGQSPFTAVLGRSPPILHELERQGISAVDDQLGGKTSAGMIRLRELAIQAMVQGSAQDRIVRATSTQTRPAAQETNLQVGEQIDVFRAPATKEQTGWRGPCEVVSVANVEEGFVEAKFHGRAISVRLQDARRSIVYITLHDSPYPQLQCIQQHLRMLKAGTMQLMAVIHDAHGWILTKAAQQHLAVFRAGLFVGFNTLHLSCLGIRLGFGVSAAGGLVKTSQCVLLWYPKSEPTEFRTLLHQGSDRLAMKQIMGPDWLDMCWVQFLGAPEEERDNIRQVIPDEPMLADDPDVGPQQPPPHVPFLQPAPDLDMNQPDSDMDEADDVMPDMPDMRPPSEPRRPLRSGSRSRSSRDPTPVGTNNSIKSHQTDTTANTLPEGWIREHNQAGLSPKRMPGPSRGTRQYGGASASGINPPQAEPVLPFRDDDNFQDVPIPESDLGDDQVLPGTEADDNDSEATRDWRDGDDLDQLFAGLKHAPPPFQGGSQRLDTNYMASEASANEPPPNTSLRIADETLDDDWLEVEFSYEMARLIVDPEIDGTLQRMAPTDVLIYAFNKTKGTIKKMIDKTHDILSAQDIRDHPELVRAACVKEIRSFQDNKAYELIDKSLCRNLCTSRWVLKWKDIGGVRSVKARLTVRGFQDMQQDLSTFSSTASRWTQRIILSVCVQRLWPCLVADVSTAFLQGLSFEEISKLEKTPQRAIEFTPPKGAEALFAELEPGYDPIRQAFKMLKAVYGLRDAPKLWRTRLCQVLRETGGVPSFSDGCLFLWFFGGILTAIFSIHVDDLKGGGEARQVQKILSTLESAFGKLTIKHKDFEHCGIMHSQSACNSVTRIHQNHYVAQLRPMEVAGLKAEAELTASQTADFLSLLGGLSWLVQTRLDIAVFICALQRSAKKPRGEHAMRINRVLKWAKKYPYFLTYRQICIACAVLAVSDSAFRKEDDRGLAMRGCVAGIAPYQEETPGNLLHIIMFWASKQRRVTRSTFSAELNSLVDAIEFAKQLAMLMAEIISPQASAVALIRLEERGELPLKIVGVIDAQSVFDALRAAELKTPSEGSLMLLLCGLKEMLRSGLLRRLFWCDTSDMLADGLGKGTVSRAALMAVGETGEWLLRYTPKGFSEVNIVPLCDQ